MSSMPETRSFSWIDWSGIATKYIRVQKPTAGHPLNYVWPSDACSLLVIDNAMVSASMSHAQSCRAIGVFIVIKPDTATRELLRNFCFLSLQFQPNNPVFPNTNIIYGQVYACFFDKCSANSPRHKGIAINIHPNWDDLVTVPVSTLNLEAFAEKMAFHPNDDVTFRCLDSLTFGASFELSDVLSRTQAYISAPSKNFDWASFKKICEKNEGKNYISEPFPWTYASSPLLLPLYNAISHPIFINFKKISGKPRKITNMAGKNRGNEAQVYSHEREWFGFKQAKALALHYGFGTTFLKRDLEDAFNKAALSPQDYRAACESWSSPNSNSLKNICINLVTVFGATNSFKMFDEALGHPAHFCLTAAVTNLIKMLTDDPPAEVFGLLRWSDDYIFILCGTHLFEPNLVLQTHLSSAIDQELKELGVTATLVDWSEKMVILGHGLDGEVLEGFMTEERRLFDLQLCLSWIEAYYAKQKKSLTEWRELAGTLRFATEVVENSQPFVCPIFGMIGTMEKKSLSYTDISIHIFTVISWFARVFKRPELCRRTLLVDHHWKAIEDLKIWFPKTQGDASFWGRGFICGNEFIQEAWSEELLKCALRKSSYDINFFEAYNIVDGMACSGEKLRGLSVVVDTDSEVWFNCWTKGKAQCPFLRALMICLMDICIHYDIRMKMNHIPGTENVDTDNLSRDMLQVFMKRNPNATRMQSLPWPSAPAWKESSFWLDIV